MNNNADALLFTHKVRVEAPQTLRIASVKSPSRISPRGLSAKRFDMEVNMHKRTISILLTVILAIAALAGCGSQGAGDSKGAGSQETAGSESAGEAAGKVRIGSKDFTENEIVAELYSLALEDAGFDVTRVFDISSSLIHQSIVSDEIDIYPEYTGTGLLSILQEDLITDPDEVYNEVKAKYEENFQLTWLDYAQANDGQGIFVSKEISDSLGIRTISDLQAHATEIRFASQGEFDERDDGIPGLTRVYGEFNWKIRMTIDGTPFKINIINDPVYIWKEGSEHSITRTGVDENGIPQYNFDLCPVGSTIASINAAKFCKKKNPFNGGVTRFIVEMMIGQYFTYVECWKKKQIFADQCFFNAKRFYHECYKEVEKDIPEEILNTMYTAQYAAKAPDMVGIIPEVTFFEFMEDIKNAPYGGEQELMDLRAELPEDVLENDKITGVSVW